MIDALTFFMLKALSIRRVQLSLLRMWDEFESECESIRTAPQALADAIGDRQPGTYLRNMMPRILTALQFPGGAAPQRRSRAVHQTVPCEVSERVCRTILLAGGRKLCRACHACRNLPQKRTLAVQGGA